MKIEKWEQQEHQEAGQMVKITRREARMLIESLAYQLMHCNVGRAEFRVDNEIGNGGDYFSIAVMPDD